MAKTATLATISPAELMPGKPIFADDVATVAEMLNWAAGQNPTTHMSMITGVAGWGSSGLEKATQSCNFATGLGLTEHFSGNIWLDADVQSVAVAAQCTFSGTDNGEIKFTIGSASKTLNSFSAGTTSSDSDSFTIAEIASTGWVAVVVESNHTTGTAADCSVDWLRIEEETIGATSLPDPADE